MHVDLNNPSDFTFENIRRLIASGDDTVDSQIRVTRNGLALLSRIVGSDALEGFVLRLETSLAGQGRVGAAAASDDRLVGRIYHSLRENWPNFGISYIGQF
jgi:hypothetical protein